MSNPTVVTPTAHLVEVFSAIQGEGLNVGERQIFIRFGFCDLRCHFCDSAHTWTAPPSCRVEQTPGLRDFKIHTNPVSLPLLLELVEKQNIPGLHDSITLTGGEPLLHTAFLFKFLPKLRSATGLPIYLETGGHRPEQVAMILPYIDSVGMDFKLPSVSGENRWQEHELFLQRCYFSQVDVFVKIIVSHQTDLADLERSAQIVATVSPEIPVFLQPVTPLEGTQQLAATPIMAPTPEQVLNWQVLMKRFVKHVRVVPQTHKMLNQL
ncbi:MAG: 7-carboxy-7-deazaguanine synthase QueE [Nostocaceae cyanobacterium]|nr:7-carboxy-7-deazaguanine synthase QueE [Nostocaceae cyanobacterium]